MGKIVYLDLRKNDLYGWEHSKNKLLVNAIKRGIRKKDKFPAVSIYKTIENKFYISQEKILEEFDLVDGGHHRAIAHYQMKKPLKCEFVDEKTNCMENYIKIKDITLEKDELSYYLHKQMFPNYR
jgi:hypothetical protein